MSPQNCKDFPPKAHLPNSKCVHAWGMGMCLTHSFTNFNKNETLAFAINPNHPTRSSKIMRDMRILR